MHARHYGPLAGGSVAGSRNRDRPTTAVVESVRVRSEHPVGQVDPTDVAESRGAHRPADALPPAAPPPKRCRSKTRPWTLVFGSITATTDTPRYRRPRRGRSVRLQRRRRFLRGRYGALGWEIGSEQNYYGTFNGQRNDDLDPSPRTSSSKEVAAGWRFRSSQVPAAGGAGYKTSNDAGFFSLEPRGDRARLGSGFGFQDSQTSRAPLSASTLKLNTTNGGRHERRSALRHDVPSHRQSRRPEYDSSRFSRLTRMLLALALLAASRCGPSSSSGIDRGIQPNKVYDVLGPPIGQHVQRQPDHQAPPSMSLPQRATRPGGCRSLHAKNFRLPRRAVVGMAVTNPSSSMSTPWHAHSNAGWDWKARWARLSPSTSRQRLIHLPRPQGGPTAGMRPDFSERQV